MNTAKVRKVFSGVLVGMALIMLIAGLTFLERHLKGRAFLIYWEICFGLTGLGGLVALLDLLVVRWQVRREQKAFVENTIKQIDADLRKKKD
jgi:hypothetical protein